jgi:hypothetical protein
MMASESTGRAAAAADDERARGEQQQIEAVKLSLDRLLSQYAALRQIGQRELDTSVPKSSNFFVSKYAMDQTSTIGVVGPYRDQPQRAMDVTINNGNQGYSKESCSQACKDYTYFGLQDENDGTGLSQCFCSNDHSATTQYGPADCGPGGGPWCNYVYEHVQPPAPPSSLGKTYYGEKNAANKYDFYEYPESMLTYGLEFEETPGFDSPGHDVEMGGNQTGVFANVSVDEAKQLCVQKGAPGFVYDNNSATCYIKSAIYPRVAKARSATMTIYSRIPTVENDQTCTKTVEAVDPSFLSDNGVIMPTLMSAEKKCLQSATVAGEKNLLAERSAVEDQLLKVGRQLVLLMGTAVDKLHGDSRETAALRQKYLRNLAHYKKILGDVAQIRGNDAAFTQMKQDFTQLRSINQYAGLGWGVVALAAVIGGVQLMRQ